MGGGVEIPDVDVVEILLPEASGDDTHRIQAAINHVAALPPDEDGFRGTLLLKRGTYRIGKSIHIRSSGIVLRGEGQGDDGTLLIATGTGKRTLIELEGKRNAEILEDTRTEIVDDYVPVGARSFTVSSADSFTVGDEVIVHRPSTTEWIHTIGMDRIEA